ncbi:MAG: DedA family protein [bacterium]|nr:DedA family protein [bacterium]
MTDTSFIYSAFQTYGLIGLWFVVAFEAFEFVASVPVGPVIVLLGGVASQGVISVGALWLTVYTALVVGDNAGFFVGRKFGRPVLLKFGTRIIKAGTLDRAEKFFLRFGVFAIFFSRFIFATIAAPLNVLAGASALPWRKYLPAEMAGQVVWATLYVSLGYFLGDRIGEIIGFVDQANVTAISVLTFGIVIFVLWLYGRALKHHVRVVRKHRQSLR